MTKVVVRSTDPIEAGRVEQKDYSKLSGAILNFLPFLFLSCPLLVYPPKKLVYVFSIRLLWRQLFMEAAGHGR